MFARFQYARDRLIAERFFSAFSVATFHLEMHVDVTCCFEYEMGFRGMALCGRNNFIDIGKCWTAFESVHVERDRNSVGPRVLRNFSGIQRMCRSRRYQAQLK